MAKIKRGSLVIPEGSTAERVKRKKLVDAIAKRRIVKRKMKSLGEEAGVFIAKARKAKTFKAFLTADAKIANAESNKMKKMATGRKISKSMGGGTEVIVDGRKNPMTFTAGARTSKYTAKQLREIPYLEKQAQRWAAASKSSARQSGGVATGIKRTAEAALGRIATGKALKATARKAGILGMVGMFMNELNGKKNGRG
jgi:hypothetical protein